MISTVMCILDWNWDQVSAKANFFMAVAAFLTILVTLCLRYLDNRAELVVSIVQTYDTYILKISNIGRKVAKNIILDVTGKPISDNPLAFVKETFDRCKKNDLFIEPGRSVFFLLLPLTQKTINKFSNQDENISNEQINDWIDTYGQEPITVKCKYGFGRRITVELSIRDYLINGTIQIDDIGASLEGINSNLNAINNNMLTLLHSNRGGNRISHGSYVSMLNITK